MKIKDILFNDINREINGVVKVGDTNENTLKIELEEYVITNEIEGNMKKFLHNFENNMLTGSTNAGVWISGFFGSGKSHFLKMLSYLLKNSEVTGKKSTQYFYDKRINSDLKTSLENINLYEIETILFNIDSVSSLERDNSVVLRIFARVFYDHLGYFGQDLKVVRLEQHLDSLGKLGTFKQKIHEYTGKDWEVYRKTYAIRTEPLYKALIETLQTSLSDIEAWLNKSDNNLSIDRLVDDIVEYVKQKPKNFRLVFLVDEIGQFIGANSSLMLNLQTFVEDIGLKLTGKVWLIVTSQESIDSITGNRQHDFSRVSARFSTRLPLSSTSVDEVIKKRVLDKKDDVKSNLRALYHANETILRNLYTFDQANIVADMIAYRNDNEFVDSYPFAHYQFKLMQNVFLEIRKSGAAGQHMAGGERSMLSGFYEVTQSLKDKDVGVLVPLYMFYNTFSTFLTGSIRQVIDRASTAAIRNEGLKEYDVHVLKLLFILRHTNDIKSTLDNLVVLMVDHIDAEKVEIKEKVQKSLKNLMRENYVSKHIDEYLFLTDEEQTINREIKEVMVDQAKIIESIHQHVFSTIYSLTKYRYNSYDFEVKKIIDNTEFGNGKLVLRLITPLSDHYDSGEHTFLMMSNNPEFKQAIVVLSKEFDFLSEIQNATQIRAYVRGRNVTQLPEATQRVIQTKQQQAAKHEENAIDYLKRALIHAKVFINNEVIPFSGNDIKVKFDKILSQHVNDVYSKLNYLDRLFNAESEITNMIRNEQSQIEGMESNTQAHNEIVRYLENSAARHVTLTMADIHKRFEDAPYGFKNIDIAALVVQLLMKDKIKLVYEGNSLTLEHRNLPSLLRQRTTISNIRISIKQAVNQGLLRNVVIFVRQYFNAMPVAEVENEILSYLVSHFETQLNQLRILENQYSVANYPGKNIVVQGKDIFTNLLSYKNDAESFFSALIDLKEELLDWKEAFKEITHFFEHQKELFNTALVQRSNYHSERGFFDDDESYSIKLDEISKILDHPKPFSYISQLNGLLSEIKAIHDKLLQKRIMEEIEKLDSIYQDVEVFASSIEKSASVLGDFKVYIEGLKESLIKTSKITFVTTVGSQAEHRRSGVLKQLSIIEQGDPSSLQGEMQPKMKTLQKSSLLSTTVIKSEEDIEKVVEELRRKLKEVLVDYDSITLS
jgi:energy-coupling factor transporter ATP-binding protein EcfA2